MDNTLDTRNQQSLTQTPPPLPATEKRVLARLAGSKWYGQPASPGGSLITINADGDKQPFFGVGLYKLGTLLGPDQPFYIFQMCGVCPTDPPSFIRSLAAHFIDEIKKVQPQGPYLIGGHCFSGWVAFEMAQQLQQQGEKVDLLILTERSGKSKCYSMLSVFLKKVCRHCYRAYKIGKQERLSYFWNGIKHKLNKNNKNTDYNPFSHLTAAGKLQENSAENIQENWRREQREAARYYEPAPYSGDVALYFARWGGRKFFFCPKGGMGYLLSGNADVHEFPGFHNTLAVEPENVEILARDIRERLEVAQKNSTYNKQPSHRLSNMDSKVCH